MKKLGFTWGNLCDWIINKNKFRDRVGSFYRMLRIQYNWKRRYNAGPIGCHYAAFIKDRVCPLKGEPK